MATPILVSERDGLRRVFPATMQANTANQSVGGAANQAATVAMTGSTPTVGGGTKKAPVKCSGLWWSYSASPTGGRLTLGDGTNNFVDIDITSAGPGFLGPFSPPLEFASDTGLTLTLAAAGAAVTGKVGMHVWQQL